MIKNDKNLYINYIMPSKEKTCKSCQVSFIPRNGNVCYCIDCKKPSIKCPHGTKKGRCKIDGCFGNEICEHKNHKQKCNICKPGVLVADKLNKCIINLITDKKIKKDTIDFILNYVGIRDIDDVKNYFKQKLELTGHTIDKCQLDHIRPKSMFNLANPKELLECCSYSNLQFLEASVNLRKCNKWSSENEEYWLKNITNKKHYDIYI